MDNKDTWKRVYCIEEENSQLQLLLSNIADLYIQNRTNKLYKVLAKLPLLVDEILKDKTFADMNELATDYSEENE